MEREKKNGESKSERGGKNKLGETKCNHQNPKFRSFPKLFYTQKKTGYFSLPSFSFLFLFGTNQTIKTTILFHTLYF